jgi:nucleotide-binding universal stress UspA family protein
MKCERICVAVALQRYVDLTPVALRQRQLARILAEAHSARVDVVSVNAPVALLPGVETTEEKLERFAEPLREALPAVTTSLREGRPSQEIRAFINEHDSDLVIVGSHSKRNPLDVGLGSTAAALTRALEVAMLMVRPTFEEMEQTRAQMIPRYPIIFPYG